MAPLSWPQDQHHVITLGTAGGPVWWGPASNEEERAGVSTAVVVGDRYYLVDAGAGAARRMAQAGLTKDRLAGFFMTHMHSDHTVDLPSVLFYSMPFELDARKESGIPLIGPGNRGMLPPRRPASRDAKALGGSVTTPGMVEMYAALETAYATDLNDRVIDELCVSPSEVYRPRDIVIPEAAGFHSNDNPSPAVEPWLVFEDDRVRVSATLVHHAPIAPAFAFRFDTDQGSVVISGDTGENQNLVKLATGADLLLHEVIDHAWVNMIAEHFSVDGGEAAREHHFEAHTSVAGAARVAEAAGVSTLALHHLVPGNTPVARWRELGAGFRGELLVPSDLDRIDFGRR
ncbi:MAG: MBL fold metallo-hydrolase [Arthrobacter sp.]|jgi:ribonuclease BN (tRNA processing enzyme)|nr:MBL fold metallo-hydrolase [Arthrobacter sp.]